MTKITYESICEKLGFDVDTYVPPKGDTKELRHLINELLEQLDKEWNLSDDPRYKGESPKCVTLSDEIEEELRAMDDDEVVELLDSLPKEQLEQILMAMEYLVDERDVFAPYIEIANNL